MREHLTVVKESVAVSHQILPADDFSNRFKEMLFISGFEERALQRKTAIYFGVTPRSAAQWLSGFPPKKENLDAIVQKLIDDDRLRSDLNVADVCAWLIYGVNDPLKLQQSTNQESSKYNQQIDLLKRDQLYLGAVYALVHSIANNPRVNVNLFALPDSAMEMLYERVIEYVLDNEIGKNELSEINPDSRLYKVVISFINLTECGLLTT